jgi:hypothetical protein
METFTIENVTYYGSEAKKNEWLEAYSFCLSYDYTFNETVIEFFDSVFQRVE